MTKVFKNPISFIKLNWDGIFFILNRSFIQGTFGIMYKRK